MMKKMLTLIAAVLSTAAQAQWEAKISLTELVPAGWRHSQVCRLERDSASAAVLIGEIGEAVSGVQRYGVRTAYLDGKLPAYLDDAQATSGKLAQAQRDVYSVEGMVGYTDESRKVFEAPSGARLSCSPIASPEPAAAAESANVAENAAPWWKSVHVCRSEADPRSEPVLIGFVGQLGARGARHVIRTVVVGGRLPGYLDGQTERLVEFEREVMPVSESVGFTNEFCDVFAMPSGARLTCASAGGV
jgi:hypothetical protein